GRTATGQFQLSVDAPERRDLWPADFVIELRYELHDAAMRCDLRIANPDRVPLPWGFGTHPYFRVPLCDGSSAGECLIQAPETEEWELIDCLPTGRRRPISENADLREGKALDGLKLDDVLTGLKSEEGRITSLVMDATAGVEVFQVTDEVFRELVV